eukprot:CAMPEP_0201493698 /NCGR_PEP_ID=MMETSP0151_2-20130828/40812_1 /ASSEMBLY_ACC=CAM_ASM_000257 /TAXON_ID=200890 /ORGANISM="Paramoeba atlantica, Strain 621/1 / CCAP 1560/9" /LENGTH=161 /DNA_ID=CAMNT_0047881327 /DNA_START=93 /DNA_END=575 /DNA_ORIENTATION=+
MESHFEEMYEVESSSSFDLEDSAECEEAIKYQVIDVSPSCEQPLAEFQSPPPEELPIIKKPQTIRKRKRNKGFQVFQKRRKKQKQTDPPPSSPSSPSPSSPSPSSPPSPPSSPSRFSPPAIPSPPPCSPQDRSSSLCSTSLPLPPLPPAAVSLCTPKSPAS